MPILLAVQYFFLMFLSFVIMFLPLCDSVWFHLPLTCSKHCATVVPQNMLMQYLTDLCKVSLMTPNFVLRGVLGMHFFFRHFYQLLRKGKNYL